MGLIVLALIILFFMTLEALTVAISGYAFLDLGFWDCWHAAWDRPLTLFLFALITLIIRALDD